VEIEQKLENWKFNKSGFITKTAKWESYEAALSGIQISRRAGIQEGNSVSFWHSRSRHSINLEWQLLYSHSITTIDCEFIETERKKSTTEQRISMLEGTMGQELR